MRPFKIVLFVAITILIMALYKKFEPGFNSKNIYLYHQKATKTFEADALRLKKNSGLVKAFTLKNKMNQRFCFLIDMKVPSGNKRFFIYDIKADSVIEAGLVTHGSGLQRSNNGIIFSNATGSNCTSLGKYKTGQPYYGKFGLAWKLYGLDKTNTNACKRFVVLHSHPCVPNNEIAPQQICTSWGCPTVSPLFLTKIKKYIDESSTPILLWIYY